MKAWLNALADRIDNLALRERALIFAMAALIVVTLINVALLDPLLSKQRASSQQVVQQQREIAGIQERIQVLVQAKPSDVDAANRARLEQLQRQLADADAFLRGKQDHLVPPKKMAELLQQLLARNRGLQLVQLKTLPATPLAGGGAGVAQMFQHGVEISVRGSYLDLLDYMAQLEKLPWQMYWARVSLTVEIHPTAQLTLTLYTLGLEKTWLAV
ncbi:MAG: agglutinin biogenesis protein [Betaproteobacteria bacterium]|nr:agglutinin biogenesis protein [Betaproteobacteria bacterium]